MNRPEDVGRTKSWMVVSSETGAEPRIEEIGKHSILRRTGLRAHDLRVLILSHPSSILVRERAIVVNLEHIKAIITATEVLMIHSSDPLFDRFLQDLLTRLTHQTPSPMINDMNDGYQANPPAMGPGEYSQNDSHAPIDPKELPFEFRVLQTCIESACMCLESEASRLEEEAYPALDNLTSQLCTLNLTSVRHIKSRLVSLYCRVQKVVDELKHLLDDHSDLAEMHLTEKLNAILLYMSSLKKDTDQSNESNSEKYAKFPGLKPDVEELEMLLKAYFAQTNGILQRLFRLDEDVNDTEDYIKTMLSDEKNQLVSKIAILKVLNLMLNAGIVVVGLFGMKQSWDTACGTVGGCILLFLLFFLVGKKNYFLWG